MTQHGRKIYELKPYWNKKDVKNSKKEIRTVL